MLSVLITHSGVSPQVRRDTQSGKRQPGGDSTQQIKFHEGGSVFSVSMSVGLAGTNDPGANQVSQARGNSGAAEVVYDKRDIDAIHLQQVGEEGTVTLGIQSHGPNVINSEGGISAPRHLRQGLKDAVIQLHEEPRTALTITASAYVKVTAEFLL